MLRKIIFALFIILIFNGYLLSQGSTKSKGPTKFRLLMTSVSVEDVNNDEIAITLNAFNTGRNPIDFSQFSSVPEEMEIKFEESFYRSNLSTLEDEITSSMLNRNIVINNGKILRNLRFNLPCSEDLRKQLTKSEKRFSKNYTPKSKSKSPSVKYKTNTKRTITTQKLFAKKVNSKNKVKSTKDEEEKISEVAATNNKMEPNTKVDKNVDKPKLTDKIDKQIEVSKPEKEKINTKETIVSVESEMETKKENSKKNIITKRKETKVENEKAKKDAYKIEQASQKEDENLILESLGASKEKANKKNSSKGQTGVAFDTREGVEASKNSYIEKSVCPDIVIEDIKIIKKTSKWVTLEYTVSNTGKGPASMNKKTYGQGIPIRAFLSSSENLGRGALPLGGGFVSYEDGELYPNSKFVTTIKLDIKKMTRFTPYVILNFDPFNALDECSKANNYGGINVGK